MQRKCVCTCYEEHYYTGPTSKVACISWDIYTYYQAIPMNICMDLRICIVVLGVWIALMVLFSVYIEIGMVTANIGFLWYICSNLVDYDMYYI